MNHSRGRHIVFATALALGVGLAIAGTATAQQAPIKVGYVGGLTGYLTQLDTAFKDGLELAFEEVNAAGGVNGRTFLLAAEDNRSDPAGSVNAMQKLLSDSDTALLTLGCSSSSVAALGPLILNAKKPSVGCAQLPTAATPDQISWMFITTPIPVNDVVTRFEYLQAKGIKKIAIIHDTTVYAKGQKDSAEQLASKYGVEILAIEQYTVTDTDMTPQLTKIRAVNPDAVVQAGGGGAKAIIAKNMVNIGLDKPLITDFNTQPKELYEVGGADTNTIVFPALQPLTYDILADSDPRKVIMKPFIEEWRKRYGEDRDPSWAGIGYDTGKILAMAVGKAGSVDGTAVRDAIEAISSYNGVTGPFSFAKDKHEGITVSPLTMVGLQDGKVVALP